MGRDDDKKDRKRDRSRSRSKERDKRSHKDSKRRRSRSRSESPNRRRRDSKDYTDRKRDSDRDRQYDRTRDNDRSRDKGRDGDRSRDEKDYRGRDGDRDKNRDTRTRSTSNDRNDKRNKGKTVLSTSSSSVSVPKTAQELEKLAEEKKVAEQAILEEEMKKRRDRVKAWQDAKAKRLAEEEEARLAASGGLVSDGNTGAVYDMTSDPVDGQLEGDEDTPGGHQGWSLEDDEDEDGIGASEVRLSLAADSVSSLEVNDTADLPPLAPLKHLTDVSNLDRDLDDDDGFPEQLAIQGGSAFKRMGVAASGTKSINLVGTAKTTLAGISSDLSASATSATPLQQEILPLRPIASRIKAAGGSAVKVTPIKLAPVIVSAQVDDEGDGVDSDYDPLDAFMTSLYGGGDVEQQKELPSAVSKQPVINASGFSVPSRSSAPPSQQVITLDQIMGSMRSSAFADDEEFTGGPDQYAASAASSHHSSSSSSDRRGWESDVGSESGANSPLHLHGGARSSLSSAMDVDPLEETETEEQREEREDRERAEFVAAIRRAREEEDVIREKLLRSDEELAAAAEKRATGMLGRVFAGEGDMVEEAEISEKKKGALELLEEAKRGKMLKEVDHSRIDYIPFRKNLYIVPRAISKLSEVEVAERREDLHIKVRGRGCPAPVNTWEQCGLSDRLLKTIQAHDLQEPFAIQRQAIPAIMCGRDVIGVAKTGSGKTLAFLLPMLRHILDQPPLGVAEGPIGLVMAPSRELAGQIFTEAKKFAQPLGIRVACIYGGADVKEQIADLKRGADIVVCTPGRLIDILCMQAGKLVSLKRVTMVVLDEADRMFDMGFEPQIKMIVQNTRPDRQTVLFSATFPKQIEKLAKSALRLPLEIVVGERSTVNKDITQYVEVHEEDDKFLRLLQLLGLWYEKGSVLVFVDKQEKCDQLFQELLKLGYPCLSLHGGKDQVDREHTLHEFKTGIKTVMIATSVAGRGLDVPDIICVVNYNCPNHLEDYVHRVGRTGRAGRKGFAYTFISEKEEQYSPVMVKALEKTGQVIPAELAALADAFKSKVERGEAQWSSSGFVGKGYTFDASEMNETQKIASMQKRAYEAEQGLGGADEQVDLDDDADGEGQAVAAVSSTSSGTAVPVITTSTTKLTPLEMAQALAASLAGSRAGGGSAVALPGAPIDAKTALARARQIAQQMSSGKLPSGLELQDGAEYFADEVEINDYPPQARRKVTSRTAIEEITDRTGVAIISRGSYQNLPPGKKPDPGAERKLYLLIEGKDDMSVRQAKLEILRVLEEETLRIGASSITAPSGRYSVV